MRLMGTLFALVCGLAASVTSAQATVRISIDLTNQRMQVVDGSGATHNWAVSTARSGFRTPTGTFRPYSLQRMHYSRKYNMSPMPHSIFFLGGYAIHGTSSVSQLGRPASHGCIRLAPGNAAKLFALVKQQGASISISGAPPHRYFAGKANKKKSIAKLSNSKKRHYAAKTGRSKVASRTHRAAPLAYAPVKRAPSVRTWQASPGLW